MSKSVLGKPHDLYGYLVAPPPYPVHLLQDLIVKEGTYGMLFGEASSAKSLIIQAIMVALASGEKFAGHFAVNGGARNVLFADFDQGADTSLRRFAKLVNWPEWENEAKESLAEHIFHYSPISPFAMAENAHMADLVEALKENKIDVLVVDCLARTLGGEDENESRTADGYFKRVKTLQEISLMDGRPLTVVILHHSRKQIAMQGGGKLPPHDDMRGASGWRDSLDFQIKAWKRGDVVGLNKLKERNAEVPEAKFTFRIHDKFDDQGEPLAVKFEYEPEAELVNQMNLLWSELSLVTEGRQDKAVGIKALSELLKANFTKGIPHSTAGIKPILYGLCEIKRAQCSNPDYQARDAHKKYWNVGS